jgi:hypothetical protein
MAGLWNRIPVWADWVVAAIAAIVVLNVNVTTAGDPLSGVGLSAGAASAGITKAHVLLSTVRSSWVGCCWRRPG